MVLCSRPSGRAAGGAAGSMQGGTPADDQPIDSVGAPRRGARRRATLPSGRAVVGGLLIVTSMLVVFVVASGAGRAPTGRAVVATRSLPVGHRLDAGDLALIDLDAPDPASSRLITDPSILVGAITTAPLEPDDLIVRSAIVADSGGDAADRPSHEVAFPLDRARALDGRLAAGELVDVVATYGSGDSARTDVVARQVRILDLDDAGKSNALGSAGQVVVTLGLADDEQVVGVTKASEVAAVVLVRSAP